MLERPRPRSSPLPTGWPPPAKSATSISVPYLRTIDFHKSGGPNVLVSLQVEGVPLQAVVDTACQITVFNHDLLQKLPIAPSMTSPILLKGAAKEGTMRGYLIPGLQFTLGSTSYKWNCCVAPITDNFILGLDFLKAHHAVVDLSQSQLILDNSDCVPISVEPVTSELPTHHAMSVKRTMLAPRSVAIEWCTVHPNVPATALLLSPMETTPDSIIVLSALVSGDAKVPVLLINSSFSPVELPSGTRLAKVEFPDALPRVRKLTLRESDAAIPDHLSSLYSRSCENLTPEQRHSLAALLIEYQDVFARSDTDLGCLKGVQHTINTGNAAPIKQRMRRTPLGFESEEDKHLQSMLDNNIIRPSFSDWSSPPVLVRKKDGSVRWCIDFRKLNDVTVKDVFPLPLIEECLDTLAGSEFFSTLDMASGYWQIEIAEQDRPKTAFITKGGLFEHNRMAFGLCNAPATFQRAMQLVLEGLTWREVLAYLDDVIVLGPSFDDHISNLACVLQRFRAYNLKLKPRKCLLFQRKVSFLGKQISQEGVAMDPSKVERVASWPVPSCLKELQSFLGFVNYHREHVANFAEKAAPLYAMLKAETFNWTEREAGSFVTLKEALITAPVLGYPLPDGQFILDTDASSTSIGAELSQVQNGEVRVIAYGSYSLTPAQRNYCTTRKELLAVVRFTRLYRHYLLGRSFMLRTDHSSLTWLMRFRQINGQLARWLEELSQYDMVVVHRPGAKHINADSLSRIPDPQECDCYRAGVSLDSLPCKGCKYCAKLHAQWARFEEDVDEVVPLAVRSLRPAPVDSNANLSVPSSWAVEQRADQELTPILRWLQAGEAPPAQLTLSSPTTKHLWRHRHLLENRQGVLFYKWLLPHFAGSQVVDDHRWLLVVPHRKVREILQDHHNTPAAGHPGMDKMLQRIRGQFYWPGMTRDVRLYVKACPDCGRSKRPKMNPRASLGVFHAGGPLERVHIDFLGPFPVSQKGNRYLLLAVDQFTKWVECFPLPDQTAERAARTLVNEFFCRLGCPQLLHSDQGPTFESALFQGLCSALSIVKTRTTPYHPSSNGQVERMNANILQMMRCFIRDRPEQWDDLVPQLAGAMRATVNRSTGFTPNLMMLGREISIPTSFQNPESSPQNPTNAPSFVLKLQETQFLVHQAARENLQGMQLYQKQQYDLKSRNTSFAVGDAVYLMRGQHQVGSCRKLNSLWQGPFLIVRCISPLLFQIRGPRRSQVVHHDRLKPCDEENLPLWLRRARKSLTGEEPADDDGEVLQDLHALFQPTALQVPTTTTQRGRVVKPPSRLSDFVC